MRERLASGWLPGLLCLLLALQAAADEVRFLPDKDEPDLNAGFGPSPEALDRSSPRRAWAAVLEACQAGRTGRGARLLNLLQLPEAERPGMGPVLFGQLCELLPRARLTPLEQLADSELGPLHDGRPTNHEVVAWLDTPDGPKSLWLRRYGDQASGQRAWLLTRQSVSMLPALHRALRTGRTAPAEAREAVNPGLGAPPADLRAETPRDAVASFRRAWEQGDLARASALLDLGGLPPAEQAETGKRLAGRLGLLLLRVHPAPFTGLSNDPDGTPERDLPIDEERVVRITVDEVPVELRLERHRLADGRALWFFSAGSVAAVEELYAQLGYGWAGDALPPEFFRLTLFEIMLWQWFGLLLGLLLALLLAWLVGRLGCSLLRGLARRTRWRWDDVLFPRFQGPLTLAAFALLLRLLVDLLRLPEGPRGGLAGAAKFLALLALGWFLTRVLDGVSESLLGVFRARKDELGMAMIPVGRRVLKPVLGGIVLIVALQNVGLDVSGLLAGLGIGGLALALAGKTTVENLFGSLTIAFDRPFKVGDYVQVGEFAGTVEDVGLRSTRLRTIERTLITIPNGQLADSRVQNFTARDRIRLAFTLNLRYETTLDQVRHLLDAFKRHLLAHPKVWPDFHRVRFAGYGASSLDLDVWVFVATTDFNEFTAVREELLLGLGRLVEEAGVQFAFGSTTVYLGQDERPAPERAAEIGRELRARADRGELWLPEPPPGPRA
jgi:MscS family membrane protein